MLVGEKMPELDLNNLNDATLLAQIFILWWK